MSFGLWTVCYHHNNWTSSDVERFRSDIEHYKHQITGLHRVLALYRTRKRNLSDALFSRGCLLALQTRSSVRKLLASNQSVGFHHELAPEVSGIQAFESLRK